MKKILGFIMLLATIASTSCGNDSDNQNQQPEGSATLTVSILGTPARRSIGPSSPNPAVESLITNLTVLVFNYTTKEIEKVVSFPITGNNYTQRVTGLSTGTEKHVVALVNVPSGIDFTSISRYDLLNTNMIQLNTQDSTSIVSTGLFMSGETTAPVRLAAGNSNLVEIPINRRVAKVILASLVIDPDAASQLDEFTLTGVSIQKARLTGTPIGPLVAPAGSEVVNYAGGLASPTGATPNFNLTRDFLLEELTLPAGYTAGTNIISDPALQRYFYVLPNDGADGHATLLNIYGTYGTGSNVGDAYYPFEINSVAGSGNTDGNYIESNKIYALSVTIRKLNLPSDDPNVVPTEAELDVKVTVQDWEIINQTVEW